MTNLNINKNICLDCLKLLVNERENTNNLMINEIINLKNALIELDNEFKSSQFEETNSINEENLDLQEAELQKSIEELTAEEKKVEQIVESQILELSKLYSDEENLWELFNHIEDASYKLEKNKSFVMNKYKQYESEIKLFSNNSILNTLFNITCYDKFGVINGARLGFGSSIIPNEINAGLGYIVFLTSIVAYKFKYEFKSYELIPMGNYSKVLKKNNGQSFELNYLNDSKLSVEKFNEACENFLEAFKELNDFLLNENHITVNIKECDLNITISDSKINGYSIAYDYNSPENWNQCMKFLLIILKNYIYNCLKKEEEEYKEVLEKVKILTSINV